MMCVHMCVVLYGMCVWCAFVVKCMYVFVKEAKTSNVHAAILLYCTADG